MSKPAAKMPVPYAAKLLSLRIWDMDEALRTNEKLTEEMRQEIRKALWALHTILGEKAATSKRGAPPKRDVWDAVHIADGLFRQYDISLEAAVEAALSPDAKSNVGSVLKTYRRWKKGRARGPGAGDDYYGSGARVDLYSLSYDQIQQATARLPKGTTRRRK